MAKSKMADLQKRGRSWLVSAALIAIGGVVGYALPQNTASPTSEVGMVTSVSGSAGGSGIQFVFKPKVGQQVTYTLEDPTPWQLGTTGAWHRTGQPSCLVPKSKTPRPVTLGVVHVHQVGSVPGGPIVVWIQCLR